MYFFEEWVLGIGPEHLLVPVGKRREHPGFFQPVQFYPDGVGGFPKLALQATEIGSGVAVQEKFEQQLDASFRRD